MVVELFVLYELHQKPYEFQPHFVRIVSAALIYKNAVSLLLTAF